MIKAALFDLDGVIFNTEPQYTIFWGGIMRRYYPEQPGLEYAIKGQTLAQIYNHYFSGSMTSELPRITAELNAFERRMEYPYIPGVEDFLRELKHADILTAIVTSSNMEKMQNVFGHHPELKGYFTRILTSEDFLRSKPDPYCYIKGQQVLGTEAKETVVLEDSLNGLKAGRASGAYVIGLATTLTESEIKPLADAVISDFTGLTPNKMEEILSIVGKK